VSCIVVFRQADCIIMATDSASISATPDSLVPQLVVRDDEQKIGIAGSLRLVEHERLKRAGVICPFVFDRDAKLISDFRHAWAQYGHIRNSRSAYMCPGWKDV
jgi:hypothetical protein